MLLDSRWANGERPYIIFTNGLVICPGCYDLTTEKEQTRFLSWFNSKVASKAIWKELTIKGEKVKIVYVEGRYQDFDCPFELNVLTAADDIRAVLKREKEPRRSATEEEKEYAARHSDSIVGSSVDTMEEEEEEDKHKEAEEIKEDSETEEMITSVVGPSSSEEVKAVRKLSLDIITEVWKRIHNILK